MSALHSFYLPPELWSVPFLLTGTEFHHLSRVVRLKPDTVIRLFDGSGRQGTCRIKRISKKEAELDLLHEELLPKPPVQCTLAAGFSKALRRGWLLEKAVELEASALWFWQGDYSQANLPLMEKETWKNSLIAGAKQCGNSWLPELNMVRGGAAELVKSFADFDRVLMLYEGDTDGRLLGVEDLRSPGTVLLILGPEGGFSPKEADRLIRAGAVPVSLGNRVLRWETAAVLTLGIAWWARQTSSFSTEGQGL